MSNKNVYVPVDPEGYGCGLILGIIINYWRTILKVILIIACIIGVMLLPSLIHDISLLNISAKVKLERGGENNSGWNVSYTLHNQSSSIIYVGALYVTLPIRFYDCHASQDLTAEFQGYFPQVVVSSNEDTSGSLEITRAYATYSSKGGSLWDFTCWQTDGCDNHYGCQQYEVLKPKFFIDGDIIKPFELKVDVP